MIFTSLPRALAGCLAALLIFALTAGRAFAEPYYGRAGESATPPPTPLLFERRHAEAAVPLWGQLDGPIAVDAAGRAIYLTDQGVLGAVAPDGNLVWSLLVGPTRGEPALGPDGTIYTAGDDQRLYAVSGAGVLLWTSPLRAAPIHGPAVDGTVIAVALADDRVDLWRPDGEPIGAVRLGAPPAAAPVILSDHTLLVPTRDGQVLHIVAGRVARRIVIAPGVALAPLAVSAGDTIVVGAADGSVTEARLDGRVVWRVQIGGAVLRSPTIGSDGGVVVAAGRALVALGPDGAQRWRRDLAGEIVAGPLIADDGSVFVATRKGDAGEIRMVSGSGADERRVPLDATPSRGLALHDGTLWVGLRDALLLRVAVPARDLARHGWAKVRGNQFNSGTAAPG